MNTKIVIYFILLFFISCKKSNFKSDNINIKENKISNAEEKKDDEKAEIPQPFNKLTNNQEKKTLEKLPDDKNKPVDEPVTGDKNKPVDETVTGDKNKPVDETVTDISKTTKTTKESCIYEVKIITLNDYNAINQFDQALYTNRHKYR